MLATTNVHPVSSSSFKFWDGGDKGDAVELKPQHALTRGEKSVVLPLHVPELQLTDPRFVSVSVGDHHLLALTSSGRTFTHPLSHKANSYGQLGMRRLETRIGGALHTVDLAPDIAKDPYALSGSRGRMPPPRQTAPNVAEPKDIKGCEMLFEIPSLNGIRVSQIAAGSRTSFARTSDGRVLGWGANEFGLVIAASVWDFETGP